MEIKKFSKIVSMLMASFFFIIRDPPFTCSSGGLLSSCFHRHVPEKVTFGNLFAPFGVRGGIIPCPEALIVLLSSMSLHRIGFGLVLIVAFSIWFAIVLVGIGIMMVYSRRFMERLSENGKIIQGLPLVSSVIISILGFVIAIQSLASGGILKINSVDIIGKIL